MRMRFVCKRVIQFNRNECWKNLIYNFFFTASSQQARANLLILAVLEQKSNTLS